MSNTKTIDQRFIEKGWTEKKIGKDAKVFFKPVSDSVIQNMPDIQIQQHPGLISLLTLAIRKMAQ